MPSRVGKGVVDRRLFFGGLVVLAAVVGGAYAFVGLMPAAESTITSREYGIAIVGLLMLGLMWLGLDFYDWL